MYFVTDEPVLFNTDTGRVLKIFTSLKPGVECDVSMDNTIIFYGTRQECEDFIYSLAGWVGAVNPVTLEKEERK
jgi:hypothetical protein